MSCPYGTQPKISAGPYISATPTDLIGWLGYTSDWLINAINRIGTVTALTTELCASEPPTIRAMAPADWLDPVALGEYLSQYALSHLWTDNCQ